MRYTTWPGGWYQAHSGGKTQDTNTGCTRCMHPHGGAISKHMAVGLQGKVPYQTADLGSAGHIGKAFKGAPLACLTFFLFIEVCVQGGIADLRSVSEENFYHRHLK